MAPVCLVKSWVTVGPLSLLGCFGFQSSTLWVCELLPRTNSFLSLQMLSSQESRLLPLGVLAAEDLGVPRKEWPSFPHSRSQQPFQQVPPQQGGAAKSWCG